MLLKSLYIPVLNTCKKKLKTTKITFWVKILSIAVYLSHILSYTHEFVDNKYQRLSITYYLFPERWLALFATRKGEPARTFEKFISLIAETFCLKLRKTNSIRKSVFGKANFCFLLVLLLFLEICIKKFYKARRRLNVYMRYGIYLDEDKVKLV